MGFYSDENCPLHFEFNGSSADYGKIVDVTQNDICTQVTDECSLSGTFTTEKPEVGG